MWLPSSSIAYGGGLLVPFLIFFVYGFLNVHTSYRLFFFCWLWEIKRNTLIQKIRTARKTNIFNSVLEKKENSLSFNWHSETLLFSCVFSNIDNWKIYPMNSIKLHYATIAKSAYKTSFNAQKIILKKA